MAYSWLPLLPPLVVIVLTILTRQVLPCLASGILVAALLATGGDAFGAVWLAALRMYQELLQPSHLYAFGFLIMLGILIQIMDHSGGMRAYTRLLRHYVKNPRQAQLTCLGLSTFFFIDDYVNNLTVGTIMQPVTDHFKVAREKLAFLLDSVSASACLLIPASSWVAFILAQLQLPGINDPFILYVNCMPYLLYPLLIIFTAWATVYFRLSYGSMRAFENAVAAPKAATHPLQESIGSIFDFIAPVTIFLGAFVYALLARYLNGQLDFLQALQQADPFLALFLASLLALSVAVLLFAWRNSNKLALLPTTCFDGLMLMKNSILLLLFAWTLSSLLKDDLQTGAYLATLVPSGLSASYLPLLMFMLCAVICASTGSAWGTIALMLPLAASLETGAGLPQLLGALISGAVAGSHFSPISDAVIMSSLSAGCPPLNHVRTQASYAINAVVGALAGYGALALTDSLPAMFLCAVGTTAGLLATRSQLE